MSIVTPDLNLTYQGNDNNQNTQCKSIPGEG